MPKYVTCAFITEIPLKDLQYLPLESPCVTLSTTPLILPNSFINTYMYCTDNLRFQIKSGVRAYVYLDHYQVITHSVKFELKKSF
jgi:hypothetical protein